MNTAMGYTHQGIVQDNGVVVFDPDQAGKVLDADLIVSPEDDGLHITDYNTGDFEWWYFDIIDREAGIFLKIVMHIGTDPLKTRIFPQLAVSVNTPEHRESFSLAYSLNDMNAGIWHCHLSIRDEVKILATSDTTPEYFININIPKFRCNFRFKGVIEGWKPLGKEVVHRMGKKKGAFAWIIPMPLAVVEGDFYHGNKHYLIQNGSGYHDHNYIRVDEHHPLHLDQLIPKWYWGKCEAGGFTVVFMDTHGRTNRIRSLMVAENKQIIYSANNLIECAVGSFGYDSILKTKYPESIMLRSTDAQFPFQAEFELEKILDRKDLLEGVNPVMKFLIKKLVANPVYHGILAKVRLKLLDRELEGYGNYESMVFRDK